MLPPLWLNTALLLVPLFLGTLLAQGWLAELPTSALLRMAPAYLLPILSITVALTAVVRLRLRRLNAALGRIAEGDFGARLPLQLPMSRDLGSVRATFAAMSEQLEDATRRLAEADRQRRRLFADLGHELATPATAILGLCDTLLDERLCPPGDGAATARLLRALSGEAERLGALTRDLAELAALEDPERVLRLDEVALDELVRRVVARREALSGGVELRCEVDPLRLRADAGRLEQVLDNLLSNALRHTPPGGHIEVTLRREAGAALLSVRDTGPGVPEEMLGHLGRRLLRLDPSRDRRSGGHGLGLSIVDEIVRRHGGELRFENDPGGGLRAAVRLPAAPVPASG